MPDLSDALPIARIRLQHLGIWYRVTEWPSSISAEREDGEYMDPAAMPEEWHNWVSHALGERRAEIAKMLTHEQAAARKAWVIGPAVYRDAGKPRDLTLFMTWHLSDGIEARIYKDGMVYFHGGHESTGVRLDHVLAMVDAYRDLKPDVMMLHCGGCDQVHAADSAFVYGHPCPMCGWDLKLHEPKPEPTCPNCPHPIREHHTTDMDGHKAGQCSVPECPCGKQGEFPAAMPGDVHAEDLGTHWRIGGYEWRKDVPPILRLLRAGLGDATAPKPDPLLSTIPRDDWATVALEQDPSGLGALTWLVMRLRELGQDVLADGLREVREAIFPAPPTWDKPSEPKPYAVGDVVRVKGQAEPMTVIEAETDQVHPVLWCASQGKVWLPAEVLEPCRPEK